MVVEPVNFYCFIPVLYKKDMPSLIRSSPKGYSWDTAQLCLVFDLDTLGENYFV